MITRFDPLRAMKVLLAHEVRFIVVGGLAGRALGSPTITKDSSPVRALGLSSSQEVAKRVVVTELPSVRLTALSSSTVTDRDPAGCSPRVSCYAPLHVGHFNKAARLESSRQPRHDRDGAEWLASCREGPESLAA
jgi:hypothetical protein